jgi:alkaline phosphatase D
MRRRDFLRYSLATGAIWAGSQTPALAQGLFAVTSARPAREVFPQSVASGDPRPDGVVLWTRVAPAAPGAAVSVAYEIAADPFFAAPLLRGVAETDADRDHTLKVQLARPELEPFTTYFYRFVLEGTASRTGRFKTLPAADSSPERIRLGYTSCQDYTNGYYTALRHLARENVDYVVHLGDYIYETASEETFQGGGPPERQFTLPSGNDRAEVLADYRFLYQKYRSDPDLQRLHERHTFINIWDDHEFANDGYREYDTDSADEAANFAPQRREDANRAWAEYQPAGVPYDPSLGPLEELTIYRSFAFGDLLELVMTDERLYRDGPPCGLEQNDRYFTLGCGAERSPDRTMLGATQKAWFLDRLTTTPARWKVWGNETMVMQFKLLSAFARDAAPQLDIPEVPGGVYINLDQWDGYAAERAEIVRTLKQTGTRNVVVITGDLHSYLAGYVRENFDDFAEPPSAVCFMAGSTTSSNLLEQLIRRGVPLSPNLDLAPLIQTSNPHIQYFNSDTHGYNLLDITRDELRCTMKAVTTVARPFALLRTLATFRVPADQVVLERV